MRKMWQWLCSACSPQAGDLVLRMYIWKIITGREDGTWDQIVGKAAVAVENRGRLCKYLLANAKEDADPKTGQHELTEGAGAKEAGVKKEENV